MTGQFVPRGMDHWSTEVGAPSEQSCVSLTSHSFARRAQFPKLEPNTRTRGTHTAPAQQDGLLVIDDGWTIEAAAERLQVDAKTVTKGRDRFLAEGDDGLFD